MEYQALAAVKLSQVQALVLCLTNTVIFISCVKCYIDVCLCAVLLTLIGDPEVIKE